MTSNQEYLARRNKNNFSVPPIVRKKPVPKFSTAVPIVSIRPLTPERSSTDAYIQRVTSIYSPSIIEKHSYKNHRLHSRVSIFRGKIFNPEPKEESFSKNYYDSSSNVNSKLKKGLEVKCDNQKFIVQTNKFDHLTVRLAEKEWLSKAREEILKFFPLFINASNSVSIVPSQIPTYIYYLGKGNNSELIKRVLAVRSWWTQASDETFPNINLAWTQVLSQKFIQTIPLSENSKSNLSSIDLTFDKTPLDSFNLGYEMITKSPSYVPLANRKVLASAAIRMYNRLESNHHLSDKKNLYSNMKKYYHSIGENVFNYLPLTFHLQFGEEDPSFIEFLKVFELNKSKKVMNLWILKPGENCNRGNGICVCNTLEQIRNELKNNPFPKTGEHTFVIQKYIEKPFLINKRKFDIRLYCLVTSINGNIQAYYYQDGYIRTSCKEYNPKAIDNKFIHLTNDAVQKKSEDYGRYEFANKMSYHEFQRYLENLRPKANLRFFEDVVPKMKKIVKDSILAVFHKIDVRKRAHCFEIFGYDFLLDENFKPWLIEVNTNPCLELSSGLLATIIPAMLENAFRIAVDPLFPQPISARKVTKGFYFNENSLENRFELIFSEVHDGPLLFQHLESRRALQDFLT